MRTRKPRKVEMEATVKHAARMQPQTAPTPKATIPAARNPGLEGAPNTGSSRRASAAEPWPALTGQAGSPCVLSGFHSLHSGSSIRARTSPGLLELALAPWLPAAPCHSRQRTWALLSHRGGVAESHILPSSLPVGLIYFTVAGSLMNSRQVIVGNRTSSGIKV